MDVGAGSCILSFFAIQAGASKVYAVEASSIAQQAEVCHSHLCAQELFYAIKSDLRVGGGQMSSINIPDLGCFLTVSRSRWLSSSSLFLCSNKYSVRQIYERKVYS